MHIKVLNLTHDLDFHRAPPSPNLPSLVLHVSNLDLMSTRSLAGTTGCGSWEEREAVEGEGGGQLGKN